MIPRMLPRTRPRRLILLCGLVPTIIVSVFSLYRPAFFLNFEYDVYDRLVRSLPARPTSDRIVIIDVDERSLASVGQWPWRRDVIGDLVARLRSPIASPPKASIRMLRSPRRCVAAASCWGMR
jgi:adenylate cyclase